ncbi:MAG TPA: hypothetical protein VHC40_10015 [Rhizomicrobium sp.]|nr:hypothetical protein [Rhizomicrobium sp.]
MSDPLGYSMESPLEDSPELIVLLGKMAARWASLDTILASALGEFIGNPAAGQAIYFASSSQQLRIGMLKATVPISPLPALMKEECIALLDRLGDLWKRRNLFLHNPVLGTEDHNPARLDTLVLRPLRKNAYQLEPISRKVLQDHLDVLAEIAIKLQFFSSEKLATQYLALLEKHLGPDQHGSKSESPPDQNQAQPPRPLDPLQSSQK